MDFLTLLWMFWTRFWKFRSFFESSRHGTIFGTRIAYFDAKKKIGLVLEILAITAQNVFANKICNMAIKSSIITWGFRRKLIFFILGQEHPKSVKTPNLWKILSFLEILWKAWLRQLFWHWYLRNWFCIYFLCYISLEKTLCDHWISIPWSDNLLNLQTLPLISWMCANQGFFWTILMRGVKL